MKSHSHVKKKEGIKKREDSVRDRGGRDISENYVAQRMCFKNHVDSFIPEICGGTLEALCWR